MMGLGDDMPNNISIESGGNYGVLDDFPLDALALDPGLMAFTGAEDEGDGNELQKAQKLRETRLAEALGKQTALLDSIGQSYKRNKEIRQKAEVRKLKNRLEKLENEKMFRELEIQQSIMANDIASQNNQLIFSHMSIFLPLLENFLNIFLSLDAEAQLRANPIILNLPTKSSTDSLNPLLLHAALRTMSNKNQPTNQVNLGIIPGGRPFPGGPIPYRHPMHPGIGLMGPPMGPNMGHMGPMNPQMRPGPFGPMQFPPGPRFGGPPPFMGPPPFFGQPTPVKKGKSIGGGPFGRAPVKLPPLNLKTARDRYDDDEDDSREIRSARKDIDVKKYLDSVLSKGYFWGSFVNFLF